MIWYIILASIASFGAYGLIHLFFGCGRKFKNGRKCGMWSCPNQKDCPFFK